MTGLTVVAGFANLPCSHSMYNTMHEFHMYRILHRNSRISCERIHFLLDSCFFSLYFIFIRRVIISACLIYRMFRVYQQVHVSVLLHLIQVPHVGMTSQVMQP